MSSNSPHALTAKYPHTDPVRSLEAGWREVAYTPDAAVDAAAGLDRGGRLPELIDGPPNLMERLNGLAVAVIGAGSIGMHTTDAIARLGAGALLICDGRLTKPESLLTHPIRRTEVGVSKARLAALRAKEISPESRVAYYDGPFQSLPRDALFDANHVILSTDNLAAEVSVAQACLHLGRPLVQAALFGPALVGQARSFSSDGSGEGSCPVCAYTAKEWAELDRGTRFSCEGAATAGGSSAPEPSNIPTVSFPHLCSISSNLAIDALLRSCLELGTAIDGAEIVNYCGYTGVSTRSPLARNPSCPLEHRAWRVCTTESALESLTPRDLARIAGYRDADLRLLSLGVEHHCFAALVACHCAGHGSLGRFVRDGQELGACSRCGAAKVLHPLHAHRDVPASALIRDFDRSLGALGVASTPTVLVRGPQAATLIRRAPSQKV
ncbi:MAG: ThiF family adenylyltransferase [Deltaproteobacteria bacterium]|nr:ThiF family adenylyltransferase [Deltaproteobacteria bacterium]